MTKRLKHLRLALAMCAVAGGLVALYAPNGESTPKLASPKMPKVGPRNPQLVASSLRLHFRVMEARSRTASLASVDPATAQLTAMLPKVLQGMVGPEAPTTMAGATLGNVTQVQVTPRDMAVIAPGPSGACLGMLSADRGSLFGSSCADVREVNQHGIALVTYDSHGGSSIMGLVPNGNASVTVQLANGQTASVAVSDNVFDYTAQGPIANVVFLNSSGVQTTMFETGSS